MGASGPDAVTLGPWHEPGIPLEEQYRSWKQRIKAPYDKHQVDAYTRTRVILMNGIENGAWNFATTSPGLAAQPDLQTEQAEGAAGTTQFDA